MILKFQRRTVLRHVTYGSGGGSGRSSEVTLIRSAGEGGQLMPYGGVRALQVIPLSSTAVSDKPTVGVFGGTRVGGKDGGVSLELGVFYDRRRRCAAMIW